MRKLVYWVCFVLVASSSILGALAWLMSLVGASPSFLTVAFQVATRLALFGSIVPLVLMPFVPKFLLPVFGYAMLFLMGRRLWLLLSGVRGVPDEFRGLASKLGYVGVASILMFAAGLALTVALRAGSGVPAGLLLVPAIFCVPWAFALSEIQSLRASWSRRRSATDDFAPTQPLEAPGL